MPSRAVPFAVILGVSAAAACASDPVSLPDGGSAPADVAAAPDADHADARPRFDGGSLDAGPCYGDPGNAGPARALFDTRSLLPLISLGGLAAGDFDGDGRRDLAVIHGNSGGWALALERSRGDGTFERGEDLPIESSDAPVASDVDGDGADELVLPGGGVVLGLDARGMWQRESVITGLGSRLSAGELSGGPPEELIDWGQRVHVYTRDPRGELTRAAELDLRPATYGVVRDMNGDGRGDLLTHSPLAVALQRGPNLYDFGPATIFPEMHEGIAADLDGDGRPEIVGSSGRAIPAPLAVYARDAADRWVPIVSNVVEHSWFLRAADLDGDAAEDVVAVGRGVALLRSVPGEPGRFVHLGRLLAHEEVLELIVDDFTGDGRPDLLFADHEGLKLAVRTALDVPALDARCLLPSAPSLPATPLNTDDGTVYVDDDHPRCGGREPCFRTIQGAIDATTPRTRIEVRTGAYTEKVRVTSERTLTSSSGAWIRGTGEDGPCVLFDGAERASIEGFVVSGCTGVDAFQEGYGIMVYGLITEVHLRRNVVRDNGPNGGILVSFSASGDDSRVVIDGNRVFGNGGHGVAIGGGINVQDSVGRGARIVVTNNIISDNTGEAGLNLVVDDVEAIVEHNTIVGNRVQFNGLHGPLRGRVQGNIVAGNTLSRNGMRADAFYDAAWPVSFEHNLVEDPAFVGPPSNIVAAPRLVPEPGGILRLDPSSPAVDAADPAGAITADFEGQRRPQDGDGDGDARADIGADELCTECP